MSMTKKDFEAIARTIASKQPVPLNPGGRVGAHGEMARAMLYEIACQIADHAATRNKAFDRRRFLKACGVNVDFP